MQISPSIPLLALASALSAPTSSAQGGSDPPPPTGEFADLGFVAQARLVTEIQRGLDPGDVDGAWARIRALASALERFPHEAVEAVPEPPHHDPARWCGGDAPARTIVARGTPGHRAVREEIPAQAPYESLRRTWIYDWSRRRVVKVGRPGWDDRFANLWNGWPPDADRIVAHLEARLDAALADASLRALGNWFEHAYADREGRVYQGITLFEAWSSGTVVEVPDTDAVPFAHLVLGDTSVATPIDRAGQRRIYAAIADGLRRWREHRSLVTAAALAAVRGRAPGVMPTPRDAGNGERPDVALDRMMRRMHWVWARSGDDLARLTTNLEGRSRDEVVRMVDTAVETSRSALGVRDGRTAALEAMQRRIADEARRAWRSRAR